MTDISVPLEELAYVCHNNAELDGLVRVNGIDSMSVVDQLRGFSPNDLANNIKTGEYTGDGSVQMEGTVEVEGTPYRFEMEYWFDDTGGGMTTFSPANK